MSDDETPDRDLTYAGEYSRRRYAEDPEFRARRRETNRLYYQRRKGDPAFVAAMRERNQVNTERRAAARAAAPVTAGRGCPPGLDAHIGQRLREYRKALRIPTADAGAHIGVGSRQYWMYERGMTTLTAGALHELAGLFHVSVDDFFVGLGGMPDAPNVPEAPDPPTDEEAEIVALARAIPSHARSPLLRFVERLAEIMPGAEE